MLLEVVRCNEKRLELGTDGENGQLMHIYCFLAVSLVPLNCTAISMKQKRSHIACGRGTAVFSRTCSAGRRIQKCCTWPTTLTPSNKGPAQLKAQWRGCRGQLAVWTLVSLRLDKNPGAATGAHV
jgi:hypothetical protein